MKNNIDISQFSLWISLCALSLVLFSWGITRFEAFQNYLPFLCASILIFLTLNTFVFLLAAKFSENNDEKKFLALAYINFIFKLILVVAIPLYYRSVYTPAESNYIIPYIVIYAAFTVLETWFLSGKIRFR